MCAGVRSSWERGSCEGRCGGPALHRNRLSSAGAWPSPLPPPHPGGAFDRGGELSHCSRAQRPPAGCRSFHPGSPASAAPRAPRAPAPCPRPLARHLSSERHCQQPRLASWTTPKGTRGLGPERSKQGGFIPVPFGGDLEQNRKVWAGGVMLSHLLAFARGFFGGRGSQSLPGLSGMLFSPGGASQQADLAASLPVEPRVGTRFKCRSSFCLLASLTLRFTPNCPSLWGMRR